MSAFFATLNGILCASVRLRVPRSGAWFASVEFPTAVSLPTSVELVLGDVTLRGTCAPDNSGSFAGTGTVLVVGGASAWGKSVPARAYHNDGGVRRLQVAQDLARAVGESLVASSALDGALGVDFVCEASPASRVLEQLFPGSDWWVGTDGVTRIGERSLVDVSSRVQILDYDPGQRCAELALLGSGPGSIADLMPGSQITDATRLGGDPFTVREVTIVVESNRLRATAWSFEGRRERVASLIRSIAREGDPKRIFARGPFRYRVFQMSGDRVELQIVNRALLDSGLPDLLPVGIAPGMAGLSAELTPGAVVLVEFVEGDPTLPVVTHFTRADEPGFLPATLSLDAVGDVSIAGGHARVLRDGEAISVNLTGTVTPGGGSSGVVTAKGTISRDTAVAFAPGAPPLGYSRAKA